MRFSPRTWSLLSILLFVAAAFFWLKGDEYQQKLKHRVPVPSASNSPAAHLGHLDLQSIRNSGASLARLGAGSPAVSAGAAADKRFPHRLRNTSKPLAELMRDDHAVLLANALIDTRGNPIDIPASLRAKDDPGSYIVQWSAAPSAEFREKLAAAGARIISYVPNNAYYVQVNKSGAEQLRGTAGVQSVLPYEPYYKLEKSLLDAAVENKSLPNEALLRLTLLPDTEQSAESELASAGVSILAHEPSPFGPQVIVQPLSDSLVTIAGMNSVQAIEPVSARKMASDLSRIVLGVATNGSTASNYLNLTGSNIVVNVNDTGLDTNHPGLKNLSVYFAPNIPMAGTDPIGHGTFVAGLIAGSGAQSPKGTNVFGSETNADFRGIAPKTKLLALPLDTGSSTNAAQVNDFVADSWLIDTAARSNYLTLKRTNSLISNNSWTYGRAVYDSSAARFDAAVRDALPGDPGSQPVLFVFAAGNSGFGTDDGSGAAADSIESPGTAKNVITVGALESYRVIDASYTNQIITTNSDGSTITNEDIQFPFIGVTDSSNQVASFSSRGNVGIGIESDFGRFKPDVVAPGSMLVSARSSGWLFNGVDTNDPFGLLFYSLNTNLAPYRYDNGSTFAAANISGMLALIQEYFESRGPTPLRGTLSPALMKALLINGSRSLSLIYDIAVRAGVNDQGWGLPNLPNTLPSYSTNDHATLDEKLERLRFVEQSPTNALATGESRTWHVTLSTNASVFPLRVTLVWSDPPGNPAVGVKLVNDLDLIVTNLDTGLVFYGNNIPGGADFTQPVEPVEGIEPPADSVNNVENVSIRDPKQLGREFTITVSARRVNVNAVSDYLARTGNTNDVVQDFALVISSDMGADPAFNDPEDPNGYLPSQTVFEKFEAPKSFDTQPLRSLGIITNGLPLLAQRVGANATLVSTNGITNQWSFYVFTNIYRSNSLVDITNGPYVAFAIFDSPNLSVPREEADLDLYVSKDPRLTNLHPAAVSAAFKSVEQGGTETVAFTNANIGDIFYVAVKSEDQQAGEFSLIGVSSQTPFEQRNGNKIILNGVPYTAWVPDGSARRPQAGTMIAIGLSSERVARAVVTNVVMHEDLGDLVGVLSHKSIKTVLNNHLITGLVTNNLVYDDNNFYPLTPGVRRSDGPGSLNLFAGTRLTGAWFLQQIDNAPSHTGRVQLLTITIDPLRKPLLNSVKLLNENVDPNEIAFYPVEVPVNATNVTFRFTNIRGTASLVDVYFRLNELPQTNLYDAKWTLSGTATDLIYPRNTNDPPLTPGTHFLAVQNRSGSAAVIYDLETLFQFRNDGGNEESINGGPISVLDDAQTNQVLDVFADKLVADVRVSVNMPHPRASDAVFTLTSPQGTRVMLAEQRGGTNGMGYGSSYLTTNAVTTNVTKNLTYTVFTDDTNLATIPIKFANLVNPVGLNPGGTLWKSGFEGATAGNYGLNSTVDGWKVVTRTNKPATATEPDQVSIITGTSYSQSGTNVLALGTAAIQRQFKTEAGKSYNLRFAVRSPKILDLFSTGLDDYRDPIPNTAADPHYQIVSSDMATYPGPEAFVLNTNSKAFRPPINWPKDNSTSQWIAPYPNPPTGGPDGSSFIFRTYVDLYDVDTRTIGIPTLKWAADETAVDIRVNGNRQRKPGSTPQGFAGATPFALGGLTNGLNIIDFIIDDFDDIEGLRVESAGIPQLGSLKYPITFTFYTNINFDIIAQLRSYSAKASIFDSGAFNLSPTGSQVIFSNIVATSGWVGSHTRPVTVRLNGRSLGDFAGAGSTISDDDWAIYTIPFVGTGGTETIEFHPQAGETWIDSVSVEASGNIYVQPEEAFAKLKGERSVGEWRLDVRDARTGAALPADGLVWKLDLNFAEPVAYADHLYNSTPYPLDYDITPLANPTNRVDPGVLRTNQVHYFIIEPCTGANSMDVTLTGVTNFDRIELLADRSGIPTGSSETDDYAVLRNNQNPGKPNGVATLHIDLNRPAAAPFVRKRVFLAVRNFFIEETNRYTLNVRFTPAAGCLYTPPPPVLAKNSAALGTLMAASAEATGTDEGDVYQVNVGPGSSSLSFNVEGDGDITLIAQKGTPPTRESFSHFQNIPGSGLEDLTITSNSGIPLSSGTWYVRVLNNTASPVVYNISATGDFVNAIAPLISASVANGQFELAWNSVAGTRYRIESSTDLRTWTTAAAVTANSASTTYPAGAAGGSAKFFRIVQD